MHGVGGVNGKPRVKTHSSAAKAPDVIERMGGLCGFDTAGVTGLHGYLASDANVTGVTLIFVTSSWTLYRQTATALEPTFQVEEATVSAAMLAEQLTAIAPMPICPPLGTPDPNSPPTPLPPMGPATATCYLSPASIYGIGPSRMRFYMTSDAALYIEVTVTPEPSSVTSATAIPFVEDTATP